MKKRRLMALLLVAVTAASLAVGCGKGKKEGNVSEDGVKEFTAESGDQ